MLNEFTVGLETRDLFPTVMCDQISVMQSSLYRKSLNATSQLELHLSPFLIIITKVSVSALPSSFSLSTGSTSWRGSPVSSSSADLSSL